MKALHVLRRVAPWAIFIAAATVMVFQFDWVALWAVLEHINLLMAFGAGTAAVIVCYVLRGIRTWMLLRRLDVRIPMGDCVLSQCVGGGLASVTPGQMGEAIRVEMLRSTGHLERGVGYAVFLGERFIDLVVSVLGGLIVILLDVEQHQQHQFVLTIAAVACGIVLLVLVFLAFGPCPGRLAAMQPHLRPMLVRADVLAINLFGSVLSWAVIVLQWHLMLNAVGIDLSVINLIQLVVIVMLAVIASLVPGGFAVSEIVAAALLVQWGIVAGQAEAGAVALRLPGLEAGLVGWVAWLWWRHTRRSACN